VVLFAPVLAHPESAKSAIAATAIRDLSGMVFSCRGQWPDGRMAMAMFVQITCNGK
jgi:hypothetical protein